MRTVVITDSTGRPSRPPSAGRVVVVPVTILLADRQVPDDQIEPRVVDEALARGEPIKTRAPGVIDYLDAVESTDAQAAVILTPAAELTAMWRHACHAPWLADRPVAVVDTRTAASGQALVAEAAAQAATDDNGSLADVVVAAQGAAARVRVIGAVGTAEPLVAAGMVEIERGRGRPTIFEARQGTIEPLRVLDGDDPVSALADLYRRERGAGDPVAFTGAGAGRGVEAMAERLAELVGSDRPPEVCSAAMTVYTGRGVIGIAWLDRA